MGAADFSTTATGTTAQKAFDRAVKDARYEHGHGGYTGTIAEKSHFAIIDPAREAERFTRQLQALLKVYTVAEQKRLRRLQLDGNILGRDRVLGTWIIEQTGSLAEACKVARQNVRKDIKALSTKGRARGLMVANLLLASDDRRIDDKWGPAGCIQLTNRKGSNEYVFFGWASE